MLCGVGLNKAIYFELYVLTCTELSSHKNCREDMLTEVNKNLLHIKEGIT